MWHARKHKRAQGNRSQELGACFIDVEYLLDLDDQYSRMLGRDDECERERVSKVSMYDSMKQERVQNKKAMENTAQEPLLSIRSCSPR